MLFSPFLWEHFNRSNLFFFFFWLIEIFVHIVPIPIKQALREKTLNSVVIKNNFSRSYLWIYGKSCLMESLMVYIESALLNLFGMKEMPYIIRIAKLNRNHSFHSANNIGDG